MSQGRFVWYELMTTDRSAAEAFYSRVAGWGTQDSGMADMPYTMFTLQERPIAGVMAMPEEARGMPPFWMGYVAVDDVDASAAKVTELGGAVHRAPADIPGVGRFAVVADPQGAVLALYRSATQDGPAPDPMTPGLFGWHELMAADWKAAFAFYETLFGWRKADAIDMGPMGIYQLFASGETTLGGMFDKPPAVPVPFWLYYVMVEAIDPAIERLNAAGGKVLNGPMEVPGGAWIVQATDPQGAMFALVGRRD